MQPTPPEPQPQKSTPVAAKFLLGAITGGLLAVIPLSYVWFYVSDVTPTHLAIIAILGLLGGTVVAWTGDRIRLADLWDSIPWFY